LWGESRGKYLSMFFCYILECSDRSFYVGVTDDPVRRLEEHNQGKGSDWTAQRRPVRLVWTEGGSAEFVRFKLCGS
jgi:putative endonuclease